MINFRYHVVSLTAVFLALAVGLILGTAALNGPVADKINSQVNGLRNTNGQLRDQVVELQTRAQTQSEFVREVEPVLLNGRLVGRSVLVLSGPTADIDDTTQVIDALKTAGATISGQIQMTNSFTDPIQDDALQDLAAQDTPASVTTLPNDGVGVETASALLATVTLANKAELTDANRTQILQAFESGGFIRMDGEVADPAPSAVVIVTGEPATDSDATARNTAFLAVVKQFDTVAAQMVLAAPTAAGTGNPVAAVRGDSSLAKSISTVDGVSFAEGQVATAMALAEQFTGQVGHYGTGKKATARIPTLH